MSCPICSGKPLPEDVSIVEKEGKRVILQGVVRAIISPDKAHYPPFSTYFTIPLYPRKGSVKYLKFGTKEELIKWGFVRGKPIQCEGCLHIIDGKEVIFDITNVEISTH